MSISESVRGELERRLPFQRRLEQLVVSEGELAVRCELSAAESLGMAVTQFEVVRQGHGQLSDADLARQAGEVCQRVQCLLEPLKAIEVDRLAHTALIRSAIPKRRGDAVSYFELTLSQHRHANLRRFSWTPGGPRTAVSFNLTPDQLERLVDDLSGALLN